MRQRGIWGLIAVILVILAGRAATKAQKFEGPRLALAYADQKAEAKRWTGRAKPPVDDEEPIPPARAAGNKDQADEPPAVEDPVGTVESFLARNRKEADDSIKSLSKEAEVLRSRLQKVEAALARWQAIAQALNADVPPSPANPADPGPQLEPIRSAPPVSKSVDAPNDPPKLPADDPMPVSRVPSADSAPPPFPSPK